MVLLLAVDLTRIIGESSPVAQAFSGLSVPATRPVTALASIRAPAFGVRQSSAAFPFPIIEPIPMIQPPLIAPIFPIPKRKRLCPTVHPPHES